MRYNHLSECLLKEWCRNDPICPCIYMKILEKEFAIIVVYVNEISIIGTPNELTKAIVHQETYIMRCLKVYKWTSYIHHALQWL